MTHEQLLQLGMLVIFIGFVIAISSFFFAAANEKDKEKSAFKFSVVGFLGFIPFGFGNDKRLLVFTALLTVVVAAATIILFSRSFKP
ncbi:DUF131 domain-containing protein [Candidatus Woesearchaeota archaeon]|nr:DUF131 domain-containing protein [Candidatus Woesearchaeota archaeon]